MKIYWIFYFFARMWMQLRCQEIVIGKELAIANDKRYQFVHRGSNYWCPQNLDECKCEGEYSFALLTCNNINNRTLEKFSRIYFPKTDFGKFSLTNSDVKILWRGLFGKLTFQYIYVKKVSLTIVETGIFNRMYESMERCEITNCDLRTFPFSDLKFFKKLQVLRLTYNAIRNIPDSAFGNVPSLKKIYLDFNKINYIGSFAFKDLVNLESLDLRYNKLVVLNDYAFAAKSKNIHLILDLSFNSIAVIRNSSFNNQCPKKLYLNNNNLRILNRATFKPIVEKMARVDQGVIHVEDNRFTCDCSKAEWLVLLRNVEKRRIKGFRCKNNDKGLEDLTLSDMGCKSY
ncbi:leucine-rich repeat-containing protein 70-like [Centruroides vittatus]|uniref:leucine-rich repeat-containing protein 70-like n=1 Tax=Centruroides vittatus TaxID=120091 RepID=UPI0035104FE6